MKKDRFILSRLVFLTAMLFAGSLHAATITNLTGGAGFPYTPSGEAYLLMGKQLDLSSTSVGSNDTVQVINIPADCKVLCVQYKVTTVATNDVTFDVGDGSDPDGYASNISATNAAGWATSQLAYTTTSVTLTNTTDGWTNTVVTGVSSTGYTDGELYTTADTVDLHFDDDPGDTGVIDTSAVVVRTAD